MKPGQSTTADDEQRALLAAFTERCHESGLDIVQPFPVRAFNESAVPTERLPDFDRDALAVVVGNTKRLWPRFLDAIAREPRRLQSPHPLDSYVVDGLQDACRSVWTRTEILWGHVTRPRAIPIQRIARAAGLATLSPSHLSIHPLYGPWIGLRAVVVFELAYAVDAPQLLCSPCESCSQPCMSIFRKAQEDAERCQEPLQRAIRSDWRCWARVREVCPVGQTHRYSDPQLEYHYTNNLQLLSPSDNERS